MEDNSLKGEDGKKKRERGRRGEKERELKRAYELLFEVFLKQIKEQKLKT